MSVYVLLIARSRRAVEMCEIVDSDDFQGLWEVWDGCIVPHFPSARHFHRGRRDEFLVIGPVDLAWTLLVSALFAVGLDLWFML